MWPKPQFPAGLVTFTEEICNGKLRFLCSAYLIHSHTLFHLFPLLFSRTTFRKKFWNIARKNILCKTFSKTLNRNTTLEILKLSIFYSKNCLQHIGNNLFARSCNEMSRNMESRIFVINQYSKSCQINMCHI